MKANNFIRDDKIRRITCNADIRGGEPCFEGTRVPLIALFDFLKVGSSIDEFMENYPSINRNSITSVLDLSYKAFEL
jgi:uncharacterized protein (DUF433 family)